MLHQKFRLQRVGMVIIDLGAFFRRQVTVIAVVGIVGNVSHMLGPNPLQDLAGDCGLT
jgi:hypothetical protein